MRGIAHWIGMLLLLTTQAAAGCAKSAPPPETAREAPAGAGPALVVGTHEALQELEAADVLVRRVTPALEGPDLAAALAAARRLYRDLEFEQSLAAIGELQQTLESRPLRAAEYDLLHAALVHRGMNELALGREDRARQAFQLAVALRPEAELPGAEYPPDSRQAYDQVRAEIRAEPPISVALTTDPPGAEVELDGRSAGVTPTTISALPGRHYLRIVSLGREPRAVPLDLATGARPLHYALPPARADVLVEQLAGVAPSRVASVPADTRRSIARELDVTRLVRIDVDAEGARGAVLDLDSGALRHASAGGPPAEAVHEVARALLASPEVGTEEPATGEGGGGIARSPWLWIAVGAVIAGAATTTAILVTRDPDQVLRVSSAP